MRPFWLTMTAEEIWQTAHWRHIATNGIQLEAATFGDDPKLAVCLRRFPEIAYSWRHQIPLLVELGYRVRVPNLRGYGQSDSQKSSSPMFADSSRRLKVKKFS